ncbi:hypothetical protein KRP22_007128 [Phytophthora ramorum]|nr:hypothetical protein KRP22_1775 [Phytophthora ramorum]
MSGKSDIAFLLNPQSSNDGNQNMMTPTSPPPPTFQRLMDVARSPDAPVMSSLILLGSCIAPLEKRSIAGKKGSVPVFSLSAVSEVTSNCAVDDETKFQQEATTPKDGTPATKAKARRSKQFHRIP